MSVLARKVPPSAYGLVAMAVVIIALLETVRDAGIGTALVGARCLGGLGRHGILAHLRFGYSYRTDHDWGFVASGPFLPRTASRDCTAVPFHRVLHGYDRRCAASDVNREMAFRKVALAQTAGAISGTVVAITVALAGGKVWSLVSGSIATSLVTTLAIWIVCRFDLKRVSVPPVPATWFRSD